MTDFPGATERPAGSAVTVDDRGDQVIVKIPPRPLGLLWLVLAFNVAVIVAFAFLGLAYIVYHIPLLDGLPLIAPKLNTPTSVRWFAGFTLGWIAAQIALLYGFCLVWLPIMTRESVTMSTQGVDIVKRNLLRRKSFKSDWLNVAEIGLSRDPERVRQSRLTVTLLSGVECPIAENVSEADREWLASVCRVVAARFERS